MDSTLQAGRREEDPTITIMEEQLQEEEEEVPCYYLCPISLHIMRDPVTLPTGITYDRDGIERWLLTAGTCPLTKQPVPPHCEPTPNHTLRRLIQAWCALHAAADSVPSIISPKPPTTDRASVASLLSKIGHAHANRRSPQELLAAVRELRDVAAESDRNRKLIAAVPDAVCTLTAVFVAAASSSSSESNKVAVVSAGCDEAALEIVSSLQLSEQCLARVIETNEALVDALLSALQRPNTASRERAALLLADVTAVMSPNRLVTLPEQAFREVVQLLRDRLSISKPGTKAALHVLLGVTPWGRNRVKAADAGAVAVLVDMLLDAPERRVCELVLGALDRLCGCAEGRAELVAHGAGVAVVGWKVLRVSEVATDKAVRVLRSVAKHAATAAVVQEMVHDGAVGALCLVAQSDEYAERTRERARETLRLHARAWRTSPCLHHHLQATYPPC